MRRAFPILAVCVALLAAGCSSDQEGPRGGAQRGGSVTVDLAGAVGSLDPARVATREGLRAAWLVYTPPLTYRRAAGRDGLDVMPGLAKAMPDVTKDGITWRITLRTGLRYSDGRPVRAADVERGIARSLRLAPRVARREFGAITGVRDFAQERGRSADIPGITTDESTRAVQFDLEAPDPRFRYALASLLAAPVPARTPIDRLGRRPPGIGPFRATRSTPHSFTLDRSTRFRLDGIPAASVDSVSGRTVAGAGRRMGRVLADRADATEGAAPVSMLPSLRSEYGSRYDEARTLRVLNLALNPRRRPFSDHDVRQAVSYALDVQALGRIWAGLLDPACNLLPPQLPEYRKSEDCPYGDRQGDSELIKARNLVEHSKARKTPVIVSGGDLGAPGPALARYLADRLQAIGLKARVARGARDRRRAQAVFGSRVAGEPDPSRYLPRSAVKPAAESDVEPNWAQLDAEAVADGALAPYGVATDGVLFSKRLDSDNCRRVHPLYGLDYSSLCLR